MTPQELKNSILQLAIQGRLVEQRPEEGTAETLYRNIIADKRKHLNGKKEGKLSSEIVPDEEIPFGIPPSWKWARFGHIVLNRDAERIPLSVEERKPLKKIYDYYGASGVIDSVDNYLFDKKLLLIGEDGANLLLRSTPIAYIANGKYWVNNHAHVLDCNEDLLSMEYVMYYINAISLAKYVTGTAQPKMNQEKMNSIPVSLPPFPEQKRIVAKIEELLPLIDRYEKAWTRLEDFNKRFPADMQKSILQLAIQGRLVEQRPEEGTGEELYRAIQREKEKLIREGKIKREKGLPEITNDETPFDIPESWKWVRISAITLLNPKNTLDDELDVGFVPMPCVSDGYRNSHTYEQRKWKEIKKGFTHFADGDIGVAKITPCFQNRKSVVFHDLPNGYGAGTTELSIVRIIGESMDRRYLLWFFKTDYFISNGVKSFTGTAGQQRIHKDYLADCLIPLPPIKEQKRIVEKLEELMPICNKLIGT